MIQRVKLPEHHGISFLNQCLVSEGEVQYVRKNSAKSVKKDYLESRKGR